MSDRTPDRLSALRCSVPSGRHPAARVFNLIALGVGAIGLAVVIDELGWDGIRKAVIGTGAWFAVIAAIDLCGSLCDAYGIRGFIRPRAAVPFANVFAAQISGIAINRLTPGNSLGEPVKVTMLVRAEVPVDVAVSAIMMFNLSTIYVGIAAIVLGVPLTALMLDLPPSIERLVWIGLGVLVAVAVILALLVRRGVIGSLVGALAAVRIISSERAQRWRARTAAIDSRLRAIGDARSSGLGQGLAGVLGSRLFNWVGTIIVLHAADIPLEPALVVASLTVGILITWMSNIVPLGLGLADGTNYALYGLLGASPVAGLLFTMINRLRTIVLALMGLLVMTIASRGIARVASR
jgi:uncharacterized protein (TIRG00374 family)